MALVVGPTAPKTPVSATQLFPTCPGRPKFGAAATSPPPPVGTIYSTVTRMVMGSRAPILQTALRAAAPAFVQWGAQLKSPNLPSETSRVPSVTWSLWGRVAHAREGKLQSARPPGAASVATSQTQLVTREALFREPRLSFSRSFFLFLPSFSTFELVGFTTVKSPNRQRLGDVQ